MLNEWGRTKGMKRFHQKVLKTGFLNDVNWIKSRIGPDWTKRLKAKNYYSGTSFRDLALSFRIGAAYAVLFRGASQFVHPGDVGNFVKPNDTGLGATLLLQPGDKWLEPTKAAATMLLCLCMDVLNARLGLGHDKRIEKEKREIGLGAKAKA